MSTDVYFDFHSPASWDLYWAATISDNTNGRALPRWEEWWAFLKEADKRHEQQYDPCRVSHLSNIATNCNDDLWSAFCVRWSRQTLTEEIVPLIVADWRVIYANTQDPKNAGDFCMPDDIADPESIEEDIRLHLGCVLDMRVD